MKTFIKKPTGAEMRDHLDLEIAECEANIKFYQSKLISGSLTMDYVAVVKLKDAIETARKRKQSLELKWSRVEL